MTKSRTERSLNDQTSAVSAVLRSAGPGRPLQGLLWRGVLWSRPTTAQQSHPRTENSSHSPERWLMMSRLALGYFLTSRCGQKPDDGRGGSWLKCGRDPEQSWVSDMLSEDQLPVDRTDEQNSLTKGKYSSSDLTIKVYSVYIQTGCCGVSPVMNRPFVQGIPCLPLASAPLWPHVGMDGCCCGRLYSSFNWKRQREYFMFMVIICNHCYINYWKVLVFSQEMFYGAGG